MAENKLYSEPAVRTPTLHQLELISERLGLHLKGTRHLVEYQEFLQGVCGAFNEIDYLPEPTLVVKYPRTPGYRPQPQNNKLNGWYWRCDIKGALSGKLVGKKVAIKDNVAVAGVPMMNGSSFFEGYVPEFDATVVTRLLDAGAQIVGKSVCENLCLSGTSFTCNKGPVKNFHNPLYSAGGSSSGSATLVAAGDVDMAIGGDQGGSIRLPACWCGVVGIKPTYGLVPYTGAMSVDPSIDHLGPIARTVEECALMLEVIAGNDSGLDSWKYIDTPIPEYTKEIQVENLNGLKIGLLKEGFGQPNSDPSVDNLVRSVVQQLSLVGATVEEVSVPCHSLGGGTGHRGFYPTSMMSFMGKSLKTKAQDLPHEGKVALLLAEYLNENGTGQAVYAKAQNLRRTIIDTYNEVLEAYDVLAMPTIPFTATKIPTEDVPLKDYLNWLWEIVKM